MAVHSITGDVNRNIPKKNRNFSLRSFKLNFIISWFIAQSATKLVYSWLYCRFIARFQLRAKAFYLETGGKQRIFNSGYS
jgi:hypothetical protein